MTKHFSYFKDPHREITLFNQRVLLLGILVLGLVGLLLMRLGWLQIFQHKMYVTMSDQNQLNLIPIEPVRGLIYDRNGVLLAENVPAFSLNIIPDRINRLETTIARLRKIVPITDDDIRQFRKALKQRRRSEAVPLRFRLNEDEVARFSVDQYRFPGVVIKAELLRRYPLGALMVPALGYVARINEKELSQIDPTNYSATNYIGKIGFEKYYEDKLHGTVGHEQVETDANGHIVRVLKRVLPKPGTHFYLTIDSRLQSAAQNALGTQRGAIVAIDPNNGEVLALVSNPTYDPNLFVKGISTKDFRALREDPDQPLYNRALRGQYPPGSTVKPFLALQALEVGATSTGFTIFDPGWYKLERSKHIYRDWNWRQGGHGWVKLESAIAQSCDTYFYTLATKLGIKQIDEVLGNFGFGKLTGIDVGEELPGLLPSPVWKKRKYGQGWYPGDTLITAIGQGFLLATPLQLAMAVSSLAMHGEGYQPHLLLKSQTSDIGLIKQKPVRLSTVSFRSGNWGVVLNAMHDVAHNKRGTAYHVMQGASYELAGKTGTAQVFSLKRNQKYNAKILPERLRDHSWFVAFAPYEKPRIALAIVVENTTDHASEVARKVLDFYFLTESNDPHET